MRLRCAGSRIWVLLGAVEVRRFSDLGYVGIHLLWMSHLLFTDDFSVLRSIAQRGHSIADPREVLERIRATGE
jgi:hypothetical protein